MTREELHQQVWSQPLRTLAKSMGISDVALAKRCKAADVPVPPRGWWARKEAGKPVVVTPLPPRAFALTNYFPALVNEADGTPEGPSDAPPKPPNFRDMAVVSDEIRGAVKTLKVPSVLTTAHPIVARLLKQDSQRTPRPQVSSYFPDRHGPKFATPIQQRRLRILACILTELDRLGCKASGNTHAGERFSINIGGNWAYILFGIEGSGPDTTYFSNEGRRYKPPERARLRLDMVEHDHREPPKLTWRDDEKPLELQATAIVQGLLLRTEEDSRKWAMIRHKWACEDHARRIREAKLAAEKAEADRIAREKAAAAARIEGLLSGADAFERATRIRRYVGAIRAAWAEAPGDVSTEDLERWAAWALGEADAIDPVASGRFASELAGVGD